MCLLHILPPHFTSASVHHQEGKRKRKRRPAVVHCLPDQNGKRAGEEKKIVRRSRKGGLELLSAAKFALPTFSRGCCCFIILHNINQSGGDAP